MIDQTIFSKCKRKASTSKYLWHANKNRRSTATTGLRTDGGGGDPGLWA
jgi:hypothetical protein